MKERAHLLGECSQRTECGIEPLLEVAFVFDRLPADPTMFDCAPDLFVGIESGGLGEQKEQAESFAFSQ